MLYLLLLGLKHILEDDAVLPPHSVRWLADDALLPEISSDADKVDGGGRAGGGDGVGGAAEASRQRHRISKMVAMLGNVLELLLAGAPARAQQPGAEDAGRQGKPSAGAAGRLAEQRSAVSLECHQMLQDLLPHPLIIVLERQGPGALARTLASETMLPTVIWTKGMRQMLWEHLHAHLDGFEMELALAPDAIWHFQRAPPVRYEEHDDADWLGGQHFGYYLTVLAREMRESGTSAPQVVAAADALEFQSMLLKRLETETLVKKQAMLVSILAGLLHQHPQPSTTAAAAAAAAAASAQHKPAPPVAHHQGAAARPATEYQQAGSAGPLPPAAAEGADWGIGARDLQVLAALLEQHAPVGTSNDGGEGGSRRSSMVVCGSDSLDTSHWQKWDAITQDPDRLEVLLHSIRVCQWIITPLSVAGRIAPAAAAAAAAAADTAISLRVPDIVEGILRWSVEGIFYLPEAAAQGAAAHPLRRLLPLALACVRFCEEVARSSQGLRRAETEGCLVEILLVCLQCDDTSIIEAATSCVGRLCASPCLHAALTEGHLHLLLLRQLLRDVHCMMEGGSGLLERDVNPRVVRRRSLATVQALGQFVNSMDHSNQMIEEELCALLTRPMMERLEAPDDFLALFAGETLTPELVWGGVNRAELAQVAPQP